MFSTAKNQKHYTPEFQQQIMDLYNAGETSYPQLERDFTAESFNQKWCTDITYLHVLKEGWTQIQTALTASFFSFPHILLLKNCEKQLPTKRNKIVPVI